MGISLGPDLKACAGILQRLKHLRKFLTRIRSPLIQGNSRAADWRWLVGSLQLLYDNMRATDPWFRVARTLASEGDWTDRSGHCKALCETEHRRDAAC
jgi:hypothetical protein